MSTVLTLTSMEFFIKVKLRYGAFGFNFLLIVVHVLKQVEPLVSCGSASTVQLYHGLLLWKVMYVCLCSSKVLLCLLARKLANCRFLVPTISTMQAAVFVTTIANSLQDEGGRFGSPSFGEDSVSEGMNLAG